NARLHKSGTTFGIFGKSMSSLRPSALQRFTDRWSKHPKSTTFSEAWDWEMGEDWQLLLGLIRSIIGLRLHWSMRSSATDPVILFEFHTGYVILIARLVVFSSVKSVQHTPTAISIQGRRSTTPHASPASSTKPSIDWHPSIPTSYSELIASTSDQTRLHPNDFSTFQRSTSNFELDSLSTAQVRYRVDGVPL
ncbi:hypothetical protein H0H93_006324, partial [Arthromyces matolae]